MTRSLLSILVGIVLAVPFIAVADLKVATLHPLLDDLAKNVGGEHVVVVPMMGEGIIHGDGFNVEKRNGTWGRVQCSSLGTEWYMGTGSMLGGGIIHGDGFNVEKREWYMGTGSMLKRGVRVFHSLSVTIPQALPSVRCDRVT